MKRRWIAVMFLGCASLVGCSASTSSESFDGASSEKGGGDSNAGMGAPAGGGTTGSGPTASPPSSGSSGASSGGPIQSGQLTSGVWDDNLNFDFFQKYLGTTSSLAGVPLFTAAERDAAHQTALQRTAKTDLDVTLLLDTTGSMDDELAYLQAELDSIAGAIHDKFPQASSRFGLVLYKDVGDVYVTRSFDFTSDLATFRANLAAQSAGGGGDYPESAEKGLADAVSLGWRTGSTARLVFWVADAPHHEGAEGAVRQALDTAVAKDVHFYPVAASGADPRTEYTMRTAAQITGGRYLFLTDDSGIGDPHAEPHIPCYQVTRFDSAIVRMVESEMTGKHIEPAASEVVRTVGSPQDGRCTLSDQSSVVIY